LNVNVRYVRGAIVGDWSAFTGQMNVQHDAVQDAGVHHFRLGNPAGLPNASVDLGGTLNFSLHYYRGILSNTVYRIGALTGANPTVTLDGSATPGTGATNTLIFEVGVLRTNATNIDTFAGSIVNGVGPARFVKKGAHTLILTGTNSTHTGGTVVESGILQIGDGVNEVGTIGTGPVTNHSALVFARAGNLSVPGAVSGAGVITNNGVAGSTVTLSGANTYTNATYVNSGKLSISGATRSPTTYNIGNGATFGIAFSALNPTATNSSVVFGTGCTNDYNFGTVNSPTSAPVVTNTSVTLGGDVTVNVTGDDLTVGTITLLSYGSRSGAGNFVLGSLPSYITSYTFNDDTVNKRVTLTITVITDPTLRYVGNANGIWDIGNTANQIWVEVGTGNPTNYYDGAKVRFDDSATGNTTITLGAIVTPFSITVSNTTKAYTFTDPSGSSYTINGAGRFIKLGTNQVTIADMQNNAYSGTVNVEAGTLKLGDGTNNANIGTGNLTNNSVVVVDSGGSVPVVGFLGIGATIPNPIHGTGRVEVINTNVLTTPNILNGASTYSGGLTVKPGANIGYNNGNSAGIGGGMRIEDATVTVGATIAGNIGTILVIGNATFVNTAGRQIDAVIAVTNGTVTFNKTALMTINANMHGIVGTITNIGGANNQQLRFNNSGANNATGSSNALWVLAPSTLLAPRNGSVNFLGALTGEGILGGPSGADGLATYNIGGLNTDTVFTGYITNNTATRNTAIIKVGTGTLVLSNAVITHTGTTRVNSGTLAYKGSSQPANSTNITVASPGILDVTGRTDGTLSLGSAAVQALMGDGTINGIVTLGASARLAPGFSVGTLTSSGAFTIGGVSTFEIDGASTNADRIIAPSIVYGGTLNLVTNGNPVTGTRTYKLFQGSLSGTFSTITTQAIAGVTWDLSTLNSAGTVTVTGPAGPPTTPTNITVSISGSQLTLSWPSNYTGWTLQTNAAGVDSPTNWFAYPGSTGTNQITVNIDKTKKNVYYRMQIIP
jgi:fibronectin-binding autotransporter adhesin